MLRALLIDDEADARADLRALLIPHAAQVRVVAEAERWNEAEAVLARDDYDIVFLDVQLRGGTGFDLVPQVRAGARIVFVTAHDSYALRAFEVNALDYLLKPISEERLADAIERTWSPTRTATARVAAVRRAAPTGYRISDAVMLRTNQDIARLVRLRDIGVIASCANYTMLRFLDATRVIVRRTLRSWESQLPVEFMRVHRTALVNLHAVQRAAHHDRQVTHVFVQGITEPVRARRDLWPQIEERLSELLRRAPRSAQHAIPRPPPTR
jgi:two-component system LytT family response regulator